MILAIVVWDVACLLGFRDAAMDFGGRRLSEKDTIVQRADCHLVYLRLLAEKADAELERISAGKRFCDDMENIRDSLTIGPVGKTEADKR